MTMNSAEKKELYELIDGLPEPQVPEARRYLRYLHEPRGAEREALNRVLEVSLEQARRGDVRPIEEVQAELRRRFG